MSRLPLLGAASLVVLGACGGRQPGQCGAGSGVATVLGKGESAFADERRRIIKIEGNPEDSYQVYLKVSSNPTSVSNEASSSKFCAARLAFIEGQARIVAAQHCLVYSKNLSVELLIPKREKNDEYLRSRVTFPGIDLVSSIRKEAKNQPALYTEILARAADPGAFLSQNQKTCQSSDERLSRHFDASKYDVACLSMSDYLALPFTLIIPTSKFQNRFQELKQSFLGSKQSVSNGKNLLGYFNEFDSISKINSRIQVISSLSEYGSCVGENLDNCVDPTLKTAGSDETKLDFSKVAESSLLDLSGLTKEEFTSLLSGKNFFDDKVAALRAEIKSRRSALFSKILKSHLLPSSFIFDVGVRTANGNVKSMWLPSFADTKSARPISVLKAPGFNPLSIPSREGVRVLIDEENATLNFILDKKKAPLLFEPTDSGSMVSLRMMPLAVLSMVNGKNVGGYTTNLPIKIEEDGTRPASIPVANKAMPGAQPSAPDAAPKPAPSTGMNQNTSPAQNPSAGVDKPGMPGAPIPAGTRQPPAVGSVGTSEDSSDHGTQTASTDESDSFGPRFPRGEPGGDVSNAVNIDACQ